MHASPTQRTTGVVVGWLVGRNLQENGKGVFFYSRNEHSFATDVLTSGAHSRTRPSARARSSGAISVVLDNNTAPMATRAAARLCAERVVRRRWSPAHSMASHAGQPRHLACKWHTSRVYARAAHTTVLGNASLPLHAKVPSGDGIERATPVLFVGDAPGSCQVLWRSLQHQLVADGFTTWCVRVAMADGVASGAVATAWWAALDVSRSHTYRFASDDRHLCDVVVTQCRGFARPRIVAGRAGSR